MIFLLGIGLLLLIGFIWSGVALARAHAQETQIRDRVTSVVTPPSRVRKIETPVTLKMSGMDRTPVDTLTEFFGFSLAKPDHYPAQWWIIMILALFAASIAIWILQLLMGTWITLTLPVLWWLFCRGFFGWCVNRRKSRLFTQFPDALSMVVRSVRVGIPVNEAIRAVARELAIPTGPEFARLGDEVAIGVPLDEALHNMAERNDLPEYRFFATALSLQAQTGGGLSETLENLADVIRKRVSVKERGNALASEAKTSAGVLAALPPLSGIGLWFINRDYIMVLFTDPIGRFVLGGAVLMLGVGIWVMRMIIQKSLQ